MQAYLLHHLQGIIVTQLTVKDKIDHVEGIANLLQQPLDVQLNKPQRWAEVHLATIAILAPFGTPAGATRLLLSLRRCLNRYFPRLVHLFGHYWVRGAVLHAEQG